MFKELTGLSTDEHTLFYNVSDLIIQNFSQMKNEVYYCCIEKVSETETRIAEIRPYTDRDELADFICSFTHFPYLILFQRKETYAKVFLSGYKKTMYHEIHSSGFEYTYCRDHGPNYKPSKMHPREVVEGAFKEFKTAILSNKKAI